MKNAGRARERLQSRPLIHVEQARDECDAARVGKQLAKNNIPRGTREKWTPVILFDLGARGFHQLAVFDARGARGFTSAAIQALVDMLYEGIAERQTALIH